MFGQGELEAPKIANPEEAHLACVFILDTSSSMAGEPIINLSSALQNFKDKLSMNETAQKRVDIAIVGFNSQARLLQDFTPISMMQPLTLKAGGTTAMSKGIHMALDLVEQRSGFYSELGTPAYIPWIFLISGSAPNFSDDIGSAWQRIRKAEGGVSQMQLKFSALGVPEFDRGVLVELTQHQPFNPRIMELENFDFLSIFDWMAESLAVISAGRVDEEAQLPPLPENAIRIDPQESSGW